MKVIRQQDSLFLTNWRRNNVSVYHAVAMCCRDRRMLCRRAGASSCVIHSLSPRLKVIARVNKHFQAAFVGHLTCDDLLKKLQLWEVSLEKRDGELATIRIFITIN